MSDSSTIFALSSGQLPAGLAVIRLSGRSAGKIVKCLSDPVEPRVASLRKLKDPKTGEILDEALVLWFPAPRSFTGEDCAEFHCHGSRAVMARIFDCLYQFDDCRLAEPGEFTRRAFLNGKMNLLEAEGLGDLIAAETEFQRCIAVRHYGGHTTEKFQRWREDLIRIRSLIEAELDFADEEDVPGSVSDQVWGMVLELIEDMRSLLEQAKAGERIRSGFKVVFAGEPNVGKSSLLNALAGREAAIVTPEAGTTRDILEVYLDLGGYPVTLSDTAGLRETHSSVEKIGIERARELIKEADCLVLISEFMEDMADMDLNADIRVLNKIDTLEEVQLETIRPRYDVVMSVKLGVGLQDLTDLVIEKISGLVGDPEDIFVSRSRQRVGIEQGIDFLTSSLEAVKPLELRADDLRCASDSLSRVLGLIDVDDVYDKIFRDFCIGK